MPNPGDLQRLNWYAYVQNNPLKYTDPSGHFEDAQLKKWYPELWETWKNDYENFWNMLLSAQFGSFVSAHFGDYKGMIEQGADSRVAVRGSDGTSAGLPQWKGSPQSNNLYAYTLTNFDEHRL